MAIKVKSAEESAGKWADNASRAGSAYKEHTIAAATDWQQKTAAAKGNYLQGVTQSGVAERFAAGVAKAGSGKFARKVEAVGQSRYSSGVGAGTSDYASGVQPYLQAISAITLDARKPRGDVANYNRSQQVGVELHKKRIAMLGSKG